MVSSNVREDYFIIAKTHQREGNEQSSKLQSSSIYFAFASVLHETQESKSRISRLVPGRSDLVLDPGVDHPKI